MKVLIAEDDKFTRDGLAELLRGEGYRVVAVADGVQAVAEFQNQQPERVVNHESCLLYTSPSPRDATLSRMPSSA